MCVAPCGPSLCECVVSGSDEYVDVCSSLSLTWSIIVWVCECVVSGSDEWDVCSSLSLTWSIIVWVCAH